MAKIPKNGRVLARESNPDGTHFVRVEWVDDEGYRVIGEFKLFLWAQPPRAIGEKAQAALSKPPQVLYHRGPRARQGNP